MDKGDLLHIGTAYVEVHTFKGKDYVTVKDFSNTTNALSKEILELREENRNLESDLEQFSEAYKRYRDYEKEELAESCYDLEKENKKLNIKVASLEGEIKGLNSVIEKLKEENQYREDIADMLPEGEGHIAEETIQDLQKRIDELVWFEKEYHRSRDRIKKLEWILEHEYGRKVPY